MTKTKAQGHSTTLNGLFDTMGVYIRLTGMSADIGDQSALSTAVAMYRSFVQKTGMQVESLQELIGDKFNKTVIIKINGGESGLKPFGLLKNETGLAKFRSIGKDGKRIEGLALVEVVPVDDDGFLYPRAMAPFSTSMPLRSYIMHPYKLAKDHVTGHETQDVDTVISGELMEFVEKSGLSSEKEQA